MKKQNVLITLLAISCLASCGSKPAGNSEGSPADESKIVISDFGTAKLEAEKFNVKDWISDDYYGGEKIIEEAKASGKAYLAAAKRSSAAKATFEFELAKYSTVYFSAAYAQTEDWLESALEMDKTYFYNIESVSPFTLAEGKNVLKARTSETSWELMEYESQNLYPGTYKVTLTVLENTPAGCPSIDYVQFKTKDASKPNVDPSTITEADIPDNDFHNLQQYKYLMDDDWTKFATYANGSDLSAPRAIKLKFDEVESASKYYLQVSEDNTFANAAVKETTNKYYEFYNAKLSTKYFYRAATSEAGLASAAVKEMVSTDLAPRVVYVPDVLNFRDIGGWETELPGYEGVKLNQGLYFRCAQLNGGNGSTASKLDSAGKGLAAIKELGIKVDIDMRDSYNVPSKSPADTADWPVKLVKASIASGTESTRWEAFGDVYTLIFNTIANADNEPVALHCTYGADRTGIASFFLEALLGMKLDDIRRDYVWTKFTQGRDPNPNGELAKWIEKTESNYDDDCFANKMRSHLMTKGLSKATLEHIREIFIPGYVAEA